MLIITSRHFERPSRHPERPSRHPERSEGSCPAHGAGSAARGSAVGDPRTATATLGLGMTKWHNLKMTSLLLSLAFLLILPLRAATASSAQTAISAYDKGDFAGAAATYEGLIKSGLQNGHVYYNLGNTYFRLHENGKAMAAYLAARRLLPRDPDIRANLTYVNAQNRDHLSYVEANDAKFLCFWCEKTTLKELFCTGLFFLVFGFLSLAYASWRGQEQVWQRTGFYSLALAGLVFVAFAISYSRDRHWGAVTASKASVRSGPGEHNTLVFELHEGAPFIRDDAKEGWWRIRLADGKSGWLAKENGRVYGL